MFDPSKFTSNKPKPFPVFLLLDISGSMDIVIDPENSRRTGKTAFIDGQYIEYVEGGTTKTQLLNEAMQMMLDSFKDEEKMETEFLISIITFGDMANLHLTPTRASEVLLEEFSAEGETAMGAALELAKELIEDKEVVPSRAYRPTVVLVSDGAPNDEWESPMQRFVLEGRSSKCFCVAMGIGEDADTAVLSRFIENTPHLAQKGDKQIPNKVFYANDAERLREFFQKVTMSVTSRTRSNNPNLIPSIDTNDDDEGYW